MADQHVQLTVAALDVPGARLYYEVRGSGPTLLIIPGGAADSTAFGYVAPVLADRYTVVTYDPRGLSRSTLDGPPTEVPVETQVDDAERLLTTIGGEPTYVFGSSGGALTGLALVARSPERVRTLVAHEAPLTGLLPDSAEHQDNGEELYEVWRTGGVDAAMAKFLADSGLGGGADGAESADAPAPEFLAAMEQMKPNFDFFLGYMLREIGAFRPDFAALRAAATRIVVAAGIDSKGQVAHRAAAALAETLGTDLVDFPGDHGGTPSDPAAFAEQLHRAMTGAR